MSDLLLYCFWSLNKEMDGTRRNKKRSLVYAGCRIGRFKLPLSFPTTLFHSCFPHWFPSHSLIFCPFPMGLGALKALRIRAEPGC